MVARTKYILAGYLSTDARSGCLQESRSKGKTYGTDQHKKVSRPSLKGVLQMTKTVTRLESNLPLTLCVHQIFKNRYFCRLLSQQFPYCTFPLWSTDLVISFYGKLSPEQRQDLNLIKPMLSYIQPKLSEASTSNLFMPLQAVYALRQFANQTPKTSCKSMCRTERVRFISSGLTSKPENSELSPARAAALAYSFRLIPTADERDLIGAGRIRLASNAMSRSPTCETSDEDAWEGA